MHYAILEEFKINRTINLRKLNIESPCYCMNSGYYVFRLDRDVQDLFCTKNVTFERLLMTPDRQT